MGKIKFKYPIYVEYEGAVAELTSVYDFTAIGIISIHGGRVWIDKSKSDEVYRKLQYKNRAQDITKGYSHWYIMYKDGEAKVVSREKYEGMKRKAKEFLFCED